MWELWDATGVSCLSTKYFTHQPIFCINSEILLWTNYEFYFYSRHWFSAKVNHVFLKGNLMSTIYVSLCFPVYVDESVRTSTDVTLWRWEGASLLVSVSVESTTGHCRCLLGWRSFFLFQVCWDVFFVLETWWLCSFVKCFSVSIENIMWPLLLQLIDVKDYNNENLNSF